MTETHRLIGRVEAAAYYGISPTSFSMGVATHKVPPAIPGTRMWGRRAIDAKLDGLAGLCRLGRKKRLPGGNVKRATIIFSRD